MAGTGRQAWRMPCLDAAAHLQNSRGHGAAEENKESCTMTRSVRGAWRESEMGEAAHMGPGQHQGAHVLSQGGSHHPLRLIDFQQGCEHGTAELLTFQEKPEIQTFYKISPL